MLGCKKCLQSQKSCGNFVTMRKNTSHVQFIFLYAYVCMICNSLNNFIQWTHKNNNTYLGTYLLLNIMHKETNVNGRAVIRKMRGFHFCNLCKQSFWWEKGLIISYLDNWTQQCLHKDWDCLHNFCAHD